LKEASLTNKQKDKVKSVIAMLQRNFDVREQTEGQRIKKLLKNRVIAHLRAILGAFQKVPKDVAPEEDPGIYFNKAMKDLKQLIKKYKNSDKQFNCPECGVPVYWNGEYYICEQCGLAHDAKQFRPALYTFGGPKSNIELVLEEGDLEK
jgi:hypothetical protein